jgi:DEAD/DEAH box helicase domain-containing protein
VLELIPNVPFWFGGLLDTLNSSEKLVEVSVSIPLSSFAVQGAPLSSFAVQGATADQLFEHLTKNLKVHICFDDREYQTSSYKEALNGYWKLVNILQFLTDVSWISRKAVLELLPEPTAIIELDHIIEGVNAWSELAERSLLTGDFSLLANSDIGIGEDSYELLNKDEVIGLAELAWEQEKVALFCEDDISEINVSLNQ